ncbi:N-acetyltransferase domain-containing protein [Chloropicon primus]|uniref:N-acetyltransferase domain-containing protein n=1 Tax=Chloropicon primus TaxID=1764295 RepID=A0A5B8MNA9_9CHLO|nr:hypothetical protein A3770_06p44870 [Chloropicon primus]UPR01189.1 N-acetyltransferase domain-containing protein [Chloropicon primus]|eukprot:QDZ21969.1 hypothetical protein A3770_06p44870 [Chloropicon primus]
MLLSRGRVVVAQGRRRGKRAGERATAVAGEAAGRLAERPTVSCGGGEDPNAGSTVSCCIVLQRPEGTRYHIRLARDLSELYQVAMLRAECYYEDRPFTRFVENFKIEYARAEFRRLKSQKVATCLVCVDLDSEAGGLNVVGTIDVSDLSQVSGKVGVSSVQSGDAVFGSYLSNFCVRPGRRRRGLGSLLLACASHVHLACDRAVAHNVYAHVNRDNAKALLFYATEGFSEVQGANSSSSSSSALVGDSKLLMKHYY